MNFSIGGDADSWD